MTKINYLNNRDLLKEIHKSKNSYCCYRSPEDATYDLILPSLSKINNHSITTAKRLRADRLTREAWEMAIKEQPKAKQDQFTVNYKKIPKEDLVFRIMTYEHIPLAPGRKKSPKNTQDFHTKINFPPFQHYKLDEDGNPYCVGKSHWKNGVANGEFSKDHGSMTPTLARMFIKLCEKYGTKGNWRGYTYNDEMQNQALLQLSQVGLQFDESKSQNPFAYYTATITNSFTRILNLEKKNQEMRDDILEMNGKAPSYTRQNEWYE